MRAIERCIDKFCYRHPRFGIHRLMLYITIGSAAAFIFTMLDRTNSVYHMFSFNANLIFKGEVWRLVTWIFFNFGDGLFGSLIGTVLLLYFYYFIGNTLEDEWGTPKFSLFFFSGMLLSIVYGLVVWLAAGQLVLLSSQYLLLSFFFAFAILYPNHTFLLFFIIPIKAKWLALADAVFYVIMIAINIGAGDYYLAISVGIVLLNLLMFCGSDLFSLLKLERRYTKRTIDFKAAARRAKSENANKPYNHKCAVCGRTDAENPALEFRYCSRCEGYHCFCLEHINNHIHFK